MSEQVDTAALVERVREGLPFRRQRGSAEFYADDALTALADRVEEMEQRVAQGEKVILKRGQEIDRQLRRVEELEREYDTVGVAGLINAKLQAEATVLRLREALEEIARENPDDMEFSGRIARAALSEEQR